MMGSYEIKAYDDSLRLQVLMVWKKSVLATHSFLARTDFEEIKALIEDFDFKRLQLFCLTEGGVVLGFVGVAGKNVDMLFLTPENIGKGLGKMLLNFAVAELGAETLDVNEQNIKALKFYKRFGFEVFERAEKDDQGRSYPLLRMKLVDRKH